MDAATSPGKPIRIEVDCRLSVTKMGVVAGRLVQGSTDATQCKECLTNEIG